MNDKKSSFWLIVLLVLIIPFALGGAVLGKRKEDEVSKRRRLSNMIGLFVLGTIILGIVAQRTVVYLSQSKEEKQTVATLDNLAEKFSKHDDEAIMSWARGEITDTWGNTVVLIENSDERGIQFRSMGRDGKIGTEDDLDSRVFKWEEPEPPKPAVVLKPKPQSEEEEKPSIGTRLKDGVTKVRNFFKDDE